ncbi:hypothetical protein [Micromonospora sp. NBRC 101691]|uniref:hypothetical protein n=1 Tax=Micromonospora sp. NBRC 101691 TaxID=3032198 RepID=UPI0024A44894|nr:hypothetical protein [Micromonospora sp. NBRC 101691]GLY21713.1 hypothetical protein Misp04_14450 [Micromonospora sp. NBRC 101691]
MTDVIRPKTQHTEEQRALLAAAVKAAREADEAEERAWQAINEARKAGVLDTVLCDQTGRSRATLNRKFGPRPS